MPCKRPDCQRPLYGATKCILHEENGEKDPTQFANTLSQTVSSSAGAEFSHIHFPKGFELQYFSSFQNQTIQGSSFFACHFHGGVNLSGKAFTGASFIETTFHNLAIFESATFQSALSSVTSFRGSTFCDEADFTNCTFRTHRSDLGDADFSNVTFKQGADFNRSRLRDISFDESVVDGNVLLIGSSFSTASFKYLNRYNPPGHSADLTISGSNEDPVWHIDAEEARFRRVSVTGSRGGGIDLKNATIEDQLSILNTEFTGAGIGLRHTRISGHAEIVGGRFHDCTIDFEEAQFSGEMCIKRCTFSRPLRIEGFREHPHLLSLQGSTFEKGLQLEGNAPSDRLFSKTENVNLTNLTFGPECSVSMRNVDLSRARLLDTDVRDVEFTGVTWAERKGLYRIKRQAVYDEIEEAESDDPDYRKLERLYRELKQSFESRKSWYDAGHFHMGEKEMQRHATDSRFRWGMLTAYRWISLYGERATPAFVVLGFVLLTFTALYIGWGLEPANPDGPLRFWGGSWDMLFWSWANSLNFALQHIGIGSPTGYELAPGGQFLTVLQRLISTTLVALAALAVRQQMKR